MVIETCLLLNASFLCISLEELKFFKMKNFNAIFDDQIVNKKKKKKV